MTTTAPGGGEPIAPSGRQHELQHGQQQATVVEVGGGLRRYRVGDREVLDGYGPDDACTGARGLPLIPWPNRLEDGQYSYDGQDHQVPLTEPGKHNAIHGFLRWRSWECREQAQDTVVMGTVLHPMMGYPFSLDVVVAYALDDRGLTVTTRATNVGSTPCPYAAGQHPYLAAGSGLVDDCSVLLDADTYLPTDDRGLPTGRDAVDGTDYDLRAGRHIGNQEIDNTYTDLARDDDGLAWVRFTAGDGHRVSVWVDQAYPYVEIYTAHTQPPPHHRTGLGVEPMTGPPNAFRSGTDLVRIEPGQSVEARWGMVVGS